MNGDQQLPTPNAGWQPQSLQTKAGDNPPSLNEPSAPAPRVQEQVLQIQHQPEPIVTPVPAPTPVAPAAMPVPPSPAPSLATQPPAALDQAPFTQPEPEEAGGFYHPAADAKADDAGWEGTPAAARPPAVEETVSWTSSGEALQAHSAAWRLRMTVSSLVAGGVVYLITRDLVPAIAIGLAGTLFGFLGARRPPALSYRLDTSGITIGQRHFAFGEFRAFSVGGYPSLSINLIPLKRFSPIMSVHFDDGLQEQIVAILSNHLPMEQHKSDAMDKIISKARF